MRNAAQDNREGYSQGYQDSRSFLKGMGRDRDSLWRFASAVDFPRAWREGYRRGRHDGHKTTLRAMLPIEQQEQLRAA